MAEDEKLAEPPAGVTVYLATRGAYSDYRVCHAFARREDAESYALGDEVLEKVLRAGPVEVRTWWELDYHADWGDRQSFAGVQAANPYVYDEQRDFDGDERHCVHEWRYGHVLNVQGWDKQLVMKVFSEQKAQYLARREGVA